ncbi:MAG TPA: hypothetical protein VFF04_04815 [Candidatus Babeliales bacterium]|nr:hypothetical protein [Candidatus Babeliales bacterium]
MKQFITPLIGVASLVILANFSAQETTEEGHKKQTVDFFGILTPQSGTAYKVNNIAIGRRHEAIPFFQKTNDLLAPEEQKPNPCPNAAKNNGKRLLKNPKDGIITKIDLAEVSEIRVPNPDAVWSYQKKKGYRKVEYIEVEIVSNDSAKTTNTYFIDTYRKLTCDKLLNDGRPMEQEVPFSAIKSLKIEGYRHREENEGKKECRVISTQQPQSKAQNVSAAI